MSWKKSWQEISCARYRKPFVNFRKTNAASYKIISTIIGVLLLISIGSALVMSFVPPVSRDALTHHLAVPKLYLEKGKIYEIPWLSFSYYPMNLDLLYAVPLYFGNDILPKQIHLLFGLMTALAIVLYLKSKLNLTMALGGGLMFLSLPIVVKLSTTAYVDLGMTFFSTVSLLLLLLWREYPLKLRYLWLSALACGLAMGTKYNGMICLMLMASLVPYVYLRTTDANPSHAMASGRQIRAIYYGFVFVFIALIAFSPWMIRNYLWTGNPLYPLWQGAVSSGAGNEETLSTVFVKRKLAYNESLFDILTIPVRVFFQGQDNQPEYFDGRLNPFLLVLPFFSFFRFGTDSSGYRVDKFLFAVYATLFLLFVFFTTDMRVRYVLPIVPPLVILSIYALDNIISAAARRWHDGYGKLILSILLMSLLSLLYLNGSYAVNLFHSVDPIPYLNGTVSRDRYIEARRPEYAAFQYINRNLSESDKILTVFLGNRGYYCDLPIVFGYQHFQQIILSATSSDEIVKQLSSEGYTHLMIRHDLFSTWVSSELGEDMKRLLAELFTQKIQLRYAKGGYGVYTIGG